MEGGGGVVLVSALSHNEHTAVLLVDVRIVMTLLLLNQAAAVQVPHLAQVFHFFLLPMMSIVVEPVA